MMIAIDKRVKVMDLKKLLLLFIFCKLCLSSSCVLRKYNNGYVCVCNSTYCDTYESIQLPTKYGQFLIVSSSKKGLRFSHDYGEFDLISNDLQNFVVRDHVFFKKSYTKKRQTKFKEGDLNVNIEVNSNRKYQTFQGFGAAMTGAVTYVFDKLTDQLQKSIYKSYFSQTEGISYSFIRLPIGGCDNDLMPWAYNESPENEIYLSNFTKLHKRDEDIVRHINSIKNITNNKDIKIVGSAWGPPRWMKTNNEWSGLGILKYQYYQTWADYHLRYVQLMDQHNISVWGLTTGNEPLNGIIGSKFIKFISLGWTPENQVQTYYLAEWVAENLGPTFRKSNYKNIKIFAGDDQRYIFPWWFEAMNKSRIKSLDFVDGFAVHWYWDTLIPVTVLNVTVKEFPNKLIFNTEACIGDRPWQHHGPLLGSWSRAELYVNGLIQDLNNFVNGWIDWNLILDETGGPNYVKNYVTAPIIANVTSGSEIYKGPIFYAIGHFSKYIIPGSYRVEAISTSIFVKTTAFVRPDGYIVIVVHNTQPDQVNVFLIDRNVGTVSVTVPPKSVHTILYRYIFKFR